MKMTLESTAELADVNGVPVRVWQGTTERGTGVFAFITRVAFPPDTSAEELDELGSAGIREAPTILVEGEPPEVPARQCTVCALHGKDRVPSRYLAGDANGLQWFECSSHGPLDHVDNEGNPRVTREPLAAWYERNGLPVPELEAAVRRGNPNMRWAESGLASPDVVAEVAQIQTLREELAEARGHLRRAELDREPHWLIKDFHALYRAAEDCMQIETLAASRQARGFLRAQLDRLKPAFLACDAERRSASGAVPS